MPSALTCDVYIYHIRTSNKQAASCLCVSLLQLRPLCLISWIFSQCLSVLLKAEGELPSSYSGKWPRSPLFASGSGSPLAVAGSFRHLLPYRPTGEALLIHYGTVVCSKTWSPVCLAVSLSGSKCEEDTNSIMSEVRRRESVARKQNKRMDWTRTIVLQIARLRSRDGQEIGACSCIFLTNIASSFYSCISVVE